MASTSSPYNSTEETTNASRACRLLLGPCTDQLRDVLRKKVPPSTFAAEIIKPNHNLPRLTPQQRDLILPRNGSYFGNYDDFDISLLYILLRNICNITPHKNGWGNVPDINDVCLSANIERVRVARNSTVHSARPSLANSEFNDIWTSVRVAVVEIDTFLSNGNFYKKEVDILRHTTMDPVQDKHYRDQLAKQYAEDQTTKECIRTLRENIGSNQKETADRINLLEENIGCNRKETANRLSLLEETQTTLKTRLHISYQQQKQFQNYLEDLQRHKSTCIPENVRGNLFLKRVSLHTSFMGNNAQSI
ncbi:uncharacterized protein LOC134233223 isoform X2 [Saccostrea cucullata]|uniref:uncharacterized protein LOC134233223 isoform X2 n=1 Tax=Saccostrea cuccullata TaxID=36930 RepID=UPI002ED1EF2B